MKRLCRWICFAVFLAALCAVPGVWAASGSLDGLTVAVSDHSPGIRMQTVNGSRYFFLPSSTDVQNLIFSGFQGALTISDDAGSVRTTAGQPVSLFALTAGSPDFRQGDFTFADAKTRLKVHVMVSDTVPALYLTSKNSSKNRNWVEQDKSNKAEGRALMVREDGTGICDEELKQIKGRGNSTWGAPKKAYQIKLKKSSDLMETGIPDEANKTWVLLANYYDESLLRNRITFDLADAMGLKFSPHSRPVDLYYDGEYRGSYLLSEKTEVGDGRVDIEDLEEEFEEANEEIDDFDSLATAMGENQYGMAYQYVTGLRTPEKYRGGYLLELDFLEYGSLEKSWISCDPNYLLVSKSPEYLSKSAMDYISEYWYEFEEALANQGTNPRTGKTYDDYVDADSLARMYLIEEVSMDVDGFKSSTFFYKPSESDKMYAGPVWDFDLAYGFGGGAWMEEPWVEEKKFYAAVTPFGKKLVSVPDLKKRASKIYFMEMQDLMENVLLGNGTVSRGRLQSLNFCYQEVAGSMAMNNALWNQSGEAVVQKTREVLESRLLWLEPILVSWGDEAEAGSFLDVPAESYFTDAVSWAAGNGVTTGTTPYTFSPYRSCTRAQVVTFLWRAAGQPEPENAEAVFFDVPEGSWYQKAVQWAVENHVTKGMTETTFEPERSCTRGQVVTFLHRAAGEPEPAAEELPFIDTNPEEYYYDPVKWALEKNITTGTTATTFEPEFFCNRAQVVTFLYRAGQDASAGSEPLESVQADTGAEAGSGDFAQSESLPEDSSAA